MEKNLHTENSLISQADRETLYGFKAITFWFTGLSGSGKSTTAKELEKYFFNQKRPCYVLDSDNLRRGLSSDLDFSQAGGQENLRRIAEVAKLFNSAGISVICAFISPTEESRTNAKKIIGQENFVEIYMSTPIEICESRDPHHLYQKARRDEIKNFTGIDSPYEVPRNPDLSINTNILSKENAVSEIVLLGR